jgi:two-component system, chemotaxis family, CheB/CheR fusion protein
VAQAHALTLRALHVTRTLTAEAGPPVLLAGDITGAIEWLAFQCEDLYALRVTVSASGTIDVPGETGSAIYQMVRELLFNVVKHSGVDEAVVHIRSSEERLLISVKDQGIGFDTSFLESRPSRQSEGYGLKSVLQRLTSLGGFVRAESTPTAGTCITLDVPVDRSPAIQGRIMAAPSGHPAWLPSGPEGADT